MDPAHTFLRWTAAGLGLVVVVLGVLALVLPWSAGGFFDDTRLEWGAFGGEIVEDGEQEEAWNWYEGEFDGKDIGRYQGVWLLRLSVPVFTIGLTLVFTGTSLVAFRRGLGGGVLLLVGGILGLVGALLTMVGIDEFEEELFAGFAFQVMDQGAGELVALIGMPVAVVAGILAIVSGTTVRPLAPAEPVPPAGVPPSADDPAAPSTSFRLDRRRGRN